MRHYFAIALGVLGMGAFLASPLAAAERPHSIVLVKGKKAKSKFKPHKGIKRKAHPVTRH